MFKAQAWYVTNLLNDLYLIECPSVCGDHADDPVCGTNGLSYGNLCQLKTVACRQNSELAVAYEGECTSSRDAPNFGLGKFSF